MGLRDLFTEQSLPEMAFGLFFYPYAVSMPSCNEVIRGCMVALVILLHFDETAPKGLSYEKSLDSAVFFIRFMERIKLFLQGIYANIKAV